jgi:hypothetical protein
MDEDDIPSVDCEAGAAGENMLASNACEEIIAGLKDDVEQEE